MAHQFIFEPGIWIGEGRMIFTSSPEPIRFFTKWVIAPLDNQAIVCHQVVEMQGIEEHVKNNFRFCNMKGTQFEVQLENDLFGKLEGKGVVDQKTIAWEFRGTAEFEGFEVYELEETGDYMMHAEYASPDQYRTIVDARIWKKAT